MAGVRNTSDMLLSLCRKPLARALLARLGVPTPVELERSLEPFRMPSLVAGYSVRVVGSHFTSPLPVIMKCASGMPPSFPTHARTPQRVVLDATGLQSTDDMTKFMLECVQPVIRSITPNSRVVILCQTSSTILGSTLCDGLSGLTRSIAKEVGAQGSVVNCVALVRDSTAPLAAFSQAMLGPIEFCLSPDAAFVSGQTIMVREAGSTPLETQQPPGSSAASGGILEGKIALVTGAARGIGEAIATRLAREGARVLAVDVPAAADALAASTSLLGAHARHLAIDITSPQATEGITQWALDQSAGLGLDVVVHNAGITMDKTLRNMKREQWERVYEVNFKAIRAMNAGLGLEGDGPLRVRRGGRVVLLSSINGIAGAFGQTNYSFTKGALIGYARSLAATPKLTEAAITVNAIAPGFIETPMVAKMPALIRNIGRRTNALQQGGLPHDVAAAVAFLATPHAGGVNGETLRVCGGNMVGK